MLVCWIWVLFCSNVYRWQNVQMFKCLLLAKFCKETKFSCNPLAWIRSSEELKRQTNIFHWKCKPRCPTTGQDLQIINQDAPLVRICKHVSELYWKYNPRCSRMVSPVKTRKHYDDMNRYLYPTCGFSPVVSSLWIFFSGCLSFGFVAFSSLWLFFGKLWLFFGGCLSFKASLLQVFCESGGVWTNKTSSCRKWFLCQLQDLEATQLWKYICTHLLTHILKKHDFCSIAKALFPCTNCVAKFVFIIKCLLRSSVQNKQTARAELHQRGQKLSCSSNIVKNKCTPVNL